MKSDFKIECDALTHDDIECIAYLIQQRTGSFSRVVGIPRGGLRLSEALEQYCSEGPVLICDDVLTTGGSMERMRERIGGETMGVVIFSRGKCPEWIKPLFQMP